MISVIIPNYNRKVYLRSCLDSVLLQPEVSQVIVVDDGSTDGSVDLLKNYNDRILLLHSGETKSGPALCRNIGLDHVTSPYTAFLDSDDCYRPGRFGAALALLEGRPDIAGAYEDVWSYDAAMQQRKPEFDLVMPADIPAERLLPYIVESPQHVLCIIGVLLRSEVALSYRFDTGLPVAEDTDYLWHLAWHHRLERVPQVESMIQRRMHEDNLSTTSDYGAGPRYRLYAKWWEISKTADMPADLKRIFWRRKIHYQARLQTRASVLAKMALMARDIWRHPGHWRYLG